MKDYLRRCLIHLLQVAWNPSGHTLHPIRQSFFSMETSGARSLNNTRRTFILSTPAEGQVGIEGDTSLVAGCIHKALQLQQCLLCWFYLLVMPCYVDSVSFSWHISDGPAAALESGSSLQAIHERIRRPGTSRRHSSVCQHRHVALALCLLLTTRVAAVTDRHPAAVVASGLRKSTGRNAPVHSSRGLRLYRAWLEQQDSWKAPCAGRGSVCRSSLPSFSSAFSQSVKHCERQSAAMLSMP